ncbi:unnamed protein product [Bathycoccus prasinos]
MDETISKIERYFPAVMPMPFDQENIRLTHFHVDYYLLVKVEMGVPLWPVLLRANQAFQLC